MSDQFIPNEQADIGDKLPADIVEYLRLIESRSEQVVDSEYAEGAHELLVKYLPHETKVAMLEERIAELKRLVRDAEHEARAEVAKATQRVNRMQKQLDQVALAEASRAKLINEQAERIRELSKHALPITPPAPEVLAQAQALLDAAQVPIRLVKEHDATP